MRALKKVIGLVLMLVPFQLIMMGVLSANEIDASFMESLLISLLFLTGLDLFVEAYCDKASS